MVKKILTIHYKHLYKCLALLFLFLYSNGADSQSDTTVRQHQKFQTIDTYKGIGLDQELRPQFHFTSLKIGSMTLMEWYGMEGNIIYTFNIILWAPTGVI